MKQSITRREWLKATGVAVGAASTTQVLQAASSEAKSSNPSQLFRYCLNTSTIRGQELGIVEEIKTAAKAGYDGIEPWMRDIDAYVKSGGSLKDLGKRIADSGLNVESAIGFAAWIVDDPKQRAEGLETAKRDMDTLRQIGGIRIAAPPVGATKQTDLDLFKAAERYRALLELGDEMGIIPQAEVWGFSKSLSRLGETVLSPSKAVTRKPACYPMFITSSRVVPISQV